MTASLDAGTSKTFVATGGTPPYTFSVVSGTGAVTSAGTYTTPGAAGSADVRVTDSGGQHADATVTIDAALAFSPGPTTIDGGQTLTLSGTGGQSPYTYSVVSGPGTVNTSTGVFTAPATPGSTVVQVSDANGGTSQITINNYATLGISPATATLDAGMSKTFVASGGNPPYTFSLVSGTGTVTADGAYSTPGAAGTADVRVTDAIGQHADAIVTIDSALGFAPGPTAVDGGLTLTLSGTGGQGPYTYSVVSGPGTVNASTGVFTAPSTAGSTVVQVTDTNGGTFQITINNYTTLGITPPSITVTAGAGQTMQFGGTGGSGSYAYTLVSGPGTLSPTGLYTAANTSGTATVQAKDSTGATAAATVRSLRIRVNGQVTAAVTDGTSWYLGGQFDATDPYSALGMAVVDAGTGNPVLGCDLQTGFLDGVVNAVVASPTAIYVGGIFSSYRGVPVGGLVKLDPQTCALDTTFNAGGGFNPGFVSSLALSGSSLYVGGQFDSYRGTPAQGLAKLNATTGALDSSFSGAMGFSSAGTQGPNALTILGSSLYAGGGFTSYRGAPVPYLVKLDLATGAIDTTFSAGVKLNGQVNVLAASGTALYAAGGFTADGGTSVQLAKLDPATAALDATFTTNAGYYPGVDAIAVSGTSIYIGLQAQPFLAKLDATTGVADGVFTQGSSLDFGVTALTVFGTSVYAGGYFTHYLGNNARHFLKEDATTGALDTTFTQATGANAALSSIAGQGNNIYAVGSLSTYRGQPANAITKITVATDAIDSTFAQSTGATNSNTSSSVNALALVGSSLYVAGLFGTFDGQAMVNFVKVDPSSGAPDPAFTVGPLGVISSLASSGTALYVGVSESGCEGAAGLGCIAKLDPTTGAADPIFAPAATTSGPVTALFFSGTSLYAGGAFQTDNGFPAQNLAKIDATTAVLDQTFTGASGLVASTSSSQPVGAFALSGSALYVGGQFTAYRGAAVSDLMKVDAASGVLDTTFTETGGTSPAVFALAAANGSVYFGGYLNSYRGVSLQNLAKVDAASGVLDTAFTQPQGVCHGAGGPSGCTGSVWSLTPVGTKLYLGGDVTSYRGSPAYFFFPVDATSGALLDP
jgi:hypothetical protein